MVTQQKSITTVCKPGKCVVCDGREAAALGRSKPKTAEERQAFYLHVVDSSAVRLRQLVDAGKDKSVRGAISKVFAYGRLAGLPEFQEPVSDAQ